MLCQLNFINCNVINSSLPRVLDVNVILTFINTNSVGDTQEFFDVSLSIGKSETDAIDFFNKKFFKKVLKKIYQFGRRPEDLIKISTAGNWNVFSEITNLESLPEMGHSCKWYFGRDRDDLDQWEEELVAKYKFGIEADVAIDNISGCLCELCSNPEKISY